MKELVEGDGYAVVWTASGEDALEGIAESEPNLVLLDTHLPDNDPFRLLEEMKQSRHARDIPVIFMTTRDAAETRLKGLEAGDDLIV